MTENEKLKSAYELAMERLRAEDREAGIEQAAPLTAAQKKKIAELRRNARAKLAELEILHRKNVETEQGDPERLRQLEEHHEIDRRRVASALEENLARVRQR